MSSQNSPSEEAPVLEDKYPPLGEDADAANEVTGLTPREARAVLLTWDLVRPDMKSHGINFFLKLFKEYPEIKTYFKGLNKLNEEELKASKRLAAHGHTVLLNISGIVDNLHDVETLAVILEKIGSNHKRRGVKVEHFQQLKKTFLMFMEENLGDAYSPVAARGWTAAMDALIKIVTSVYEQPDEEDED